MIIDPDSIYDAWLARLNRATEGRGSLAALARLYCETKSAGGFEAARIHFSRIRSGKTRPSLDLFLWLTAWMDGQPSRTTGKRTA